MDAGKLRIVSDGTPVGTAISVLGEDGNWTDIKGVAELTLHAEPDQLVEVTMKFWRPEIDVIAYRVRDLTETPRLMAEERRLRDEEFNARAEAVHDIR